MTLAAIRPRTSTATPTVLRSSARRSRGELCIGSLSFARYLSRILDELLDDYARVQNDAAVPIPSRSRAVVRTEVRFSDRAAGTGLAVHTNRRPHAHRRAHRFRQNAGCISGFTR